LFLTHSEPKIVKQALEDANWLAAIHKEYDSLLKQNTWDLVSLPPHRQAMDCKWIFWLKENIDESINKYKNVDGSIKINTKQCCWLRGFIKGTTLIFMKPFL